MYIEVAALGLLSLLLFSFFINGTTVKQTAERAHAIRRGGGDGGIIDARALT